MPVLILKEKLPSDCFVTFTSSSFFPSTVPFTMILLASGIYPDNTLNLNVYSLPNVKPRKFELEFAGSKFWSPHLIVLTPTVEVTNNSGFVTSLKFVLISISS